MADSSNIEKPPSTHSGTSPWILDTGASFHMTYDSSTLTSVQPVESPVRVLTADGTPLPVASRGTLTTRYELHGKSRNMSDRGNMK